MLIFSFFILFKISLNNKWLSSIDIVCIKFFDLSPYIPNFMQFIWKTNIILLIGRWSLAQITWVT